MSNLKTVLEPPSAEDEADPAEQQILLPLAQWGCPSNTVTRTVRDKFRRALMNLREGVLPHESSFQPLDGLPEVQAKTLDWLAPEPDWTEWGSHLEQSVEFWRDRLERFSEQTFSLIVAPPFSGITQGLSALAYERGWALIEPPENLLMDDNEAAQWWQERLPDGPWVLADLGCFWVRHHQGLALVRQLIHRLVAGNGAKGLVGCSSWSWRFWEDYLPEIRLSALTLRPFTATRLQRWFGSVSTEPLEVRTATKGNWVLATHREETPENDRSAHFLRDLAAISRGNPGVAWNIWRKALRREAENDDSESGEEGNSESEATKESGLTRFWVVDMDKLSLPVMPTSTQMSTLTLYQSLLFHGPSDLRRMCLASGLEETRALLGLHSLVHAGVVEQAGDCWTVTELGYPAMRQQLLQRGFTSDEF